MSNEELLELAIEAREASYSPYSNFMVGAALLAKDGTVFKGCNIENASFSVTNCAERTALFKAISEGVTEFEKIAIVGGKKGEPLQFCPPCGVCRQALTEFCNPNTFSVILGTSKDDAKAFLLKEIIPLTFTSEDLED